MSQSYTFGGPDPSVIYPNSQGALHRKSRPPAAHYFLKNGCQEKTSHIQSLFLSFFAFGLAWLHSVPTEACLWDQNECNLTDWIVCITNRTRLQFFFLGGGQTMPLSHPFDFTVCKRTWGSSVRHCPVVQLWRDEVIRGHTDVPGGEMIGGGLA